MNEINLRERVKAICDEKGFKLSEVAAMMGVEKSSLSKLLSGNPTLSKLTDMANALGVPLSEIFATGSDVTVRCPKCGEQVSLNVSVTVRQ